MNILHGIAFVLLAVDCAYSFNEYVFEFGVNSGPVLYDHEGNIPILQTVTHKDIVVPSGVAITYVRVTVNAISPPKVDYYADTNRVSIKYNWTQVTLSTYKIVAKGYYTRT